MDGIYSAARELDEGTLFGAAVDLAKQALDRDVRAFAVEAMKRARRVGGRRRGIGARQEFDFYGSLLQQPRRCRTLAPATRVMASSRRSYPGTGFTSTITTDGGEAISASSNQSGATRSDRKPRVARSTRFSGQRP